MVMAKFIVLLNSIMNKVVNTTDLQKLKDLGCMKFFTAESYIFHQGEPGNVIYIILSGQVSLYIKAADGTSICIAHLESGDFLGEMSLLDGLPRNTTALAETDTTLIAITKNNFQTSICDPSSIPYRLLIGLIHQVNQLYNELSQCKGGGETLTESTEDSAWTALVETGSPMSEESTNAESAHLIKIENNPKINELGNLFPERHKTYNRVAPDVYKDFLISSQAKCPVCSEIFEAKKQYISKLKFERSDPDFRKHYSDFEPLWYSLWVCPHCYYTNFYPEYDTIPVYKKQKVLTRTEELKKQFSFEFTVPRTIDQVFSAYYLALVSAQLYDASPLKFGKIWLQLSWLYHDVDDKEMFDTASNMAFKNYYDVLYKSGESLTVPQAQQCFILLGELYLIRGNEKEALRHFYTAIKKDGGKEAFNQQAEERIHDIRREKMNF
ncbi:MAG TPA: hypothetical protein DDW65_21885 [Firmicutes bacterium]|nr:hypothetical protein [Bacillota bacterium]